MKKAAVIITVLAITLAAASCMQSVPEISVQAESLSMAQTIDDIEIITKPLIVEETDSQRFKREYEALNTVLGEDGTNKYFYLSIAEDNNVVYLSFAELLDFIDDGTGLLYFGRPACPWCRLLVPHMLAFARESGTTIYYFDIEADRTANNHRYRYLLSVFEDYLPIDTVTQSKDDPDFDPTLKRVVLPQLFSIRNGNVEADLLMFQHEYLSDDDSEKIEQILRDMHDAITFHSDSIADDCDTCP